MQIDTQNKRPFGVTIAIIASSLIYSVIPLLQVGLVLIVAERFRNRESSPLLPNGQELQQVASGGNIFGDISNERLIFQTVLAVLFLILAYFTWRGRPSFMRFVFMVSVIAFTLITFVLSILPGLTSSDGSSMSGGTLDVLTIPTLCVQIALNLAIPLYVVWYLNRAPARAFFRGKKAVDD